MNECIDKEDFDLSWTKDIKLPHWEKKPWLMGTSYFCSRCGENYGTPYEYCPNCGVRMTENLKENDYE